MVLFAAEDRITVRVDVNRVVPLRGQRHSQAVAQNDLGPADPSAQLSYVKLLLQPAAGLDAFLADLQNPSSPSYHHWLTPEQFADRFGLSAGDIAKLMAWLRGQGLSIHDVARGRHWITFSGSVSDLARAFHTEFHRYAVKGETHIANSTDPSVPEALAGIISGLSGLNDFRPVSLLVDAGGTRYTSASGNHYLAPDDFAVIYDLEPLYAAGIDGTGVTIAVAGASDINISNIHQFRSLFNLPVNDPQVILYGSDPGHNSAETEADLDVEWAGAVARGAQIIYVNSGNPLNSVAYAIDQNLAPIITYSFGSCEQDDVSLRSIAQQANAQGITWMAAAGDSGAATCDLLYSPTAQASLGPTASFPADLPEVTAVGGTQFADSGGNYWATNNSTDASALSYIPETVWNSNSTSTLKDAAGGGPSSFFTKPWWQIGTPDDNSRDVPDVSLSAGTHDAYLITTTASAAANSFAAVGGTSASSPSFAGIVALLNQYLVNRGTIAQPGLGNINPVLYRMAQSATDVFHDITTGNNNVPCVQGSPQCVNGWMGYAAGPGYDLATGLGTVDANHLIDEWNTGTVSQTSLTATPTSVDAAATVTLTATVTGAGSVPPTGTIQFSASKITLGTVPVTPSSSGASATANLSVSASSVVLAPAYALYSGDTVYGSSSGSAAVTLNTSTGHSVIVPFIGPNPIPEAPEAVWPFQVILYERGGVATKLTSVTFAGTVVPLSLFPTTNIPANGSMGANLEALPADIPTTPFNGTFVFSGQDADGTLWTQQLAVTFTGPPGTFSLPAIGLTSSPAAVQQNTSADPTCQWKQDFTLDEHGGFLVELTKFTVGAVDFTTQIQQIFGTTRIAPYGTLHGSMCWASTNTFAPSTKTLTITGTAPVYGTTPSATVTVPFQPAASSPASFSVSPAALTLSAPGFTFTNMDLSFSGGSPAWQANVLPANSTTSWLTVGPVSGIDSAQLTVLANAAKLSPGAYQATIAVSAPGAVPDHILIPVTLVVGASASMQITAVVNAATYQTAAAPGMLTAVYGVGLANANSSAPSIPLPLSIAGVSATVNGISAPIVGTYPGSSQINIQIPYEAGSGPALLAINNNGQIATYSFPISVAAPGIFGIWDTTGHPLTSVQQGQVVVAYITGDGDVAPFLATGATPASTTAFSRLPKPRLPLLVSVGGVAAATPPFWGIPSGEVGVTQINFTIPANAPLGEQPLVVTVGGIPSNALTVTVLAPPGQ